ncbi:MAG TPA: adenylate/guanylate cyclase domain-containing protein [Actinomycetota bacterium]|nr:adenylate/guanylate cyclase domain-containing protein [Actinomycetota bacterium]
MVVCPSCGRENPDGFKFCGFCTAPLDTAPTALEERKVISILFVDLVGFTARSHAADPEDVRAALVPYHALLKREIERFGGTVEKFIGDAVMAVFGAPVAHEDDAERAVRAALRIIDAISELNQDIGLDLSVRAAVNTGEGLVTLSARTSAGESMVTGDVVNTASRLQNVAPVNGIVVGEVTYRSTRDVIDYDELEPVTVKGKPEPVALWKALSARSRIGIDADIAAATPFIGRDYEQTILKETFLRTVRDSSPQLVTIVGEPGVGKSRLLAEFSSFIDDQHELIFWRQGRSLPYGEGLTFWALGEIVKAQAGILGSDNSEQATEKLTAAVASLVNESSEHHWFLSRLGPLAGIELSGGSNPQKEESFTAWRRFLEAIAEKGPLVLVFEDLHWADPSLLEFVEHLVDWVEGVPMFVVCTARPELYDEHPNWGGGKRNITVIALAPLNDSETAQLISSLLSQAVLPAEVHSVLLERAGGNPLYAEEFVRMLSDRGILRQRGRVFSLVKDEPIPVPESVHALIAARLDTLSRDRKSLLQDASVAGKVFWSEAVASIGDVKPDAARLGLRELGDKELVRASRRSSMEGHHEYSFWHALIRDVCYLQIPRAARAQKHMAMAAWFEKAAERLDDHAEVLAHHYSTALELARPSRSSEIAELEAQTKRFLVLAADRALQLDAAKALSLYLRALEFLGPDDPETPHVLHETGMACRFLDRLSEAQDYLERAAAAHGARGDKKGQTHSLRQLAYVLREHGHSEQSRALALEAVGLLKDQAPDEALSLAYAAVAFFELIGGASGEALLWATKALDVARSCNSTAAVAEALEIRGLARCDSGDAAGLEDLRGSIAINERAGMPFDLHWGYNNLAEATRLINGPAAGLELNLRAQEIARTHGYLHDARWSACGALPMLWELGRWDQVLDEAEELLAGEKVVGYLVSWGVFYRALVAFHRGQEHEGPPIENSFLPTFREMEELDALVPALAFVALLHAHRGEAASTLALAEEFLTWTDQTPFVRARNLPNVVRALCAVGERDTAAGLLLPERAVVFENDRHAVVTAHAIVAEEEGEAGRGLGLYCDAARRWNDHGFVLEEGQALLGAGRCLLALGRASEASTRLQEAREIFDHLRARPLVAETDRHLGEATALSF